MRKLVLVAVAALITAALAPLVPRATDTYQIYWYYSLKAGYGAPAAYIDDMKVAPLTGYGSVGGGKWVELQPGIHVFKLRYAIWKKDIPSEQGLGYPTLVVILADTELSGPPSLVYPELTGHQYWVLSASHPSIWNKTEDMGDYVVYEAVTYFEITPDGLLKIMDGSEGYGVKVWDLSGAAITTTATNTSSTTTTSLATTTTTTTFSYPPPTTTPRPEPSEGFFVKPDSGKAVAVTAGAGALGLILLLLVVRKP